MVRKMSGVVESILENAQDLHDLGLMGGEEYRKITARHLGPGTGPAAKPISANEIKKLRERAKMSQAAFAWHLNLTTGYISQLERGTKQPKGAVLALLNVIRRTGIEAVL